MPKSSPPSSQLTPAELLAFGQTEPAEQRLQNILHKQPDNLEAQLELIRLYLYQGDYERARQQVEAAKHRWPGEKRLDGFLECARRAERKHRAKSRRAGTSEASPVFTSDKTFYLIRFVFCILVVALAFSVFYYYFYYLDSTSQVGSAAAGLVSRPLPTLVLHGAFYLLLLAIVYLGLRNLVHFLFLPDIVVVKPEGLFLRGKLASLRLPWPEIASATLIERGQWRKKEHHWVYDHWLEIEPSRKPIIFSPKYFLTRIPEASFGKFNGLVDSVKNFTKVAREKRVSGFGAPAGTD